jgi:hypothetical protein
MRCARGTVLQVKAPPLAQRRCPFLGPAPQAPMPAMPAPAPSSLAARAAAAGAAELVAEKDAVIAELRESNQASPT